LLLGRWWLSPQNWVIQCTSTPWTNWFNKWCSNDLNGLLKTLAHVVIFMN